MKLQINFNPETKEVVGWSEDVDNLNTGSLIEAEIIDISDEDFEKLKQHKYIKRFDKELIFQENAEVVDLERQKELKDKLQEGKITTKETNELILNLLGQ